MKESISPISSASHPERTCKVFLIEAEDIDLVWDDVVPLIEKALQHAEVELIQDDIKNHLDKCDLRLWIAL